MLSSFVALDTETTGLDFERDRVIEIAAVRFENGVPVAEFEALISPGDRPLSPVSHLITGIDPAELAAAPPAAETLAAFLAFVGDRPLVAHNAPFDAHFVRRAAEAEGLSPPPGPWLDSLTLARAAWPEWDSHRLDALAERIEADRDGEHRALPDARRAGLVFLAAQRAVRARVAAQGLRDLASLAASLPGWNLVFDGEASANDEGGHDGGGSSRATGVPATAGTLPGELPRSGAESALLEALKSSLEAEGATAVETPAGSDEHSAALRAALEAARAGRRVLLAVPDAWTLAALLRSESAREAGEALAPLGLPSDYPDRSRLAALAREPARVPPEEREALLPLIAWADRFPGKPVQSARALSSDRNRLSWSRVRCETWGDDAAAQGARAEAERARVLLVTHATLCAHVALDGALLPACDALVATGAHRLPDAALEGAGRRAALFRLREALQLLRPAPEREEGAWTVLAPAIPETERDAWKDRWFAPDRELQKFLQKAGRRAEKLRAPGDFRVRYAEHAALAFGADPAPVLEALRANEALLEGIAREGGAPAAEARRILAPLRAFRADFDFLCAARDPGWLHWFEDVSNPHRAALRAIPRDLGRFGAALGEIFPARVFASPALLARFADDPARDAAFFLRSAGLAGPDDPVTAKVVPDDPATAQKAPRLVMAPFAPASGNAEQTAGFARFLVETAGPFARDGVLVFCPSQTALRNLRDALRPLLPEDEPLWTQYIDGSRDALGRLYGAGKGGWVLATEGLADLRDADGRAPALWVLTRLPFPPPQDPVLETRGELLRSGREPWRAAAVLRLKREWHALRAAGSAPRTVWLLDARAAGDGLGARLAKAAGWEAVTAKDGEELKMRDEK